jgi:hypothetical protein
VSADAQRTVNWYPEKVESGQGKANVVLYPTPGLIPFATLPTGPVRGLLYEAGKVYAVAGARVYTVTSAGVVVDLGPVANDGGAATLCTNGVAGHQVFITSAGKGYIVDTISGVLTPVTLLGPTNSGTYIDGYFVAFLSTGFQISELLNGLVWPGLDVAQRSEGSDPIVQGLQNHREIWVWGELTTEVWYNAGSASFPFAPIPGVFIEVGCGAQSSVARFDHQVAWIAQNRDGDRMAVLAAQYVPQRISTHAVEMAWRRYTTIRDAIGFVYQDDGHTFYQVTFPSAGTTWVFDGATQLWHERAYWNGVTGEFEASRVRAHTRAFERHIVGDRATGELYDYSLLAGTDDGDTIRRMRRTPHLSRENKRTFFSRAEIDLEAGLGLAVGQGVNPQVMLRWSDDRAHTWSSEWWTSAGRMGQYMARAYWVRIGSSRDRVIEVTVSDPVPWRLIDGYLHAEEGAA